MDGLLIDSEDLYTIVTNEVLRAYDKPDLPWSIKAQMQGRPGPQAGAIFHKWAQLPITHAEFMEKQGALQRKYFTATKPLPGAVELVETLAKTGTGGESQGKVHIALATSSHKGNFGLKTDHLARLFDLFPAGQKVLGDDPRIPKGRGKPAPEIYLLALKTINDGLRERGEKDVKPAECLVFEDSVPGVESGRRAGMQVVWCPHPGLLKEYEGREKEVLAGLCGEHESEGERTEDGKVGELDDGWAVLVESLEKFDYARYGIETQD